MKFLSQLFEARGTVWKERAFRRAFFRLTIVYLGIIAVIIAVFSALVIYSVEGKLEEQQLRQTGLIQITAEEALLEAQRLQPEQEIEDTSYELKHGTLLFTIDFADGSDLEFDMFSGEIVTQADTPAASLYELMTDEIDEVIWLLAGGIFLLASFGSIAVARTTLTPIAVSADKQTRFVSDASHELRNPLAAIKTTLEAQLRAKNVTSSNQELFTDLLSEVNRLIATTEALLQLEQVQHTEKNTSGSNTQEILNKTLQRLQSMITEKQLQINTDLSVDTTPLSGTDSQTIVYNLLHNAIKFADKDSVVTIAWDKTALTVQNQGEVINPSDVPYIFDRFYKGNKSRAFTDNHSNGLGLAIVKEIVDQIGGTISVVSNKTDGTTFTVQFS